MTSDKWIAVHTGLPHYLDHLGVLCIVLDLPLIVTEKTTFKAAQKFYPLLKVEYIDLPDLTAEYLATHFDVIFESGHLWALELLPLFELLFNKKMRMVYCPHGNSDKGYSEQNRVKKDISLVYGFHMVDHLHRTGELRLLNRTILTGNYRYGYFRQHQRFYDALLNPLLQGKIDLQKKSIFYAPTWPDGENRSSFVGNCARVIEEVGEFYNVLVRWHPFLEELHPALTEQLLGSYAHQKGVVFLHTFPSIYPILNYVDGYLGDFSSIGYDFLAFNKPLYFLDSHFGTIYSCGVRLTQEKHLGRSMMASQETDSLKKLREKTYTYVFGEEREAIKIKKELEEALAEERTSWLPH